MPRIPTYEQRERPPRSTGVPLSGVKAPLQDPAAAGIQDLAAGAGHASDVFKARMIQKQQEEDALAVSSALSKFHEAENTRVLPEYQKTGMAAVGDPADPATSVHGIVKKRYDEIIQEVSGDLKSDNARKMFAVQAARIRDSGLQAAATHVAKEHRAAQVQAFKGEVSASVDKARAGLLVDSTAVENEIRAIQQRTDEIYPGFDTTEQKAGVEKAVLAAYVEHLLSIDPEGAEMALSHYRPRLGEQYQRLEPVIQAESLYAKVKTKGMDFDAAEDWIDKQGAYSRKVRDAAKSLVNADHAEFERRRNEGIRDRKKAGMDGFYKALMDGNLNTAQRIVNGWDDEAFSMHDKYLALELLKREGTAKTNPVAERGLYIDIQRGKLKSTADILADPRAAQLTVADLRQLENDLPKDGDPLASTQTTAVNSALDGLKRNYDYQMGKSNKNQALWPLFQKELLDDVAAWRANNPGKVLTRQQIIEMGVQMLEPRDVPGRWTDISAFEQRIDERKKAAQGNDSASVDARLAKIPVQAQQRILSALQAAGKPVTKGNVWALFEQNWPDDAAKIAGSL